MTLDGTAVQAVCFDLGNTLIEFGPRQLTAQYGRLTAALESGFGSCDADRLKAIRDRQIVAPYRNGYREGSLEEVCRELIEEMYGITATEAQVADLARVRYESFLEVVELAADVIPLLRRLQERYRLAVLSNYPCGRSIRDGLDKVGLTEFFEVIVVSGEVGYVKPHPEPFGHLLGQLGEEPAACVYVGDNWLADIQGAKRAGMRAVLTTQHVPYETFAPQEGDHAPDARISHIGELAGVLLETG
jgi:putative hydrolase of the HAD superfamily